MAFDIDIAAEVENPIVRALDPATADQQIGLLDSCGLTVSEQLEAAPKVKRILFEEGKT
ncbi:MAG: hypothetical protein KAT26_07980 [Marinosulfonomonas sp.]|nr:hypothetical protein [Marinosulfonomonas sp.]